MSSSSASSTLSRLRTEPTVHLSWLKLLIPLIWGIGTGVWMLSESGEIIQSILVGATGFVFLAIAIAGASFITHNIIALIEHHF